MQKFQRDFASIYAESFRVSPLTPARRGAPPLKSCLCQCLATISLISALQLKNYDGFAESLIRGFHLRHILWNLAVGTRITRAASEHHQIVVHVGWIRLSCATCIHTGEQIDGSPVLTNNLVIGVHGNCKYIIFNWILKLFVSARVCVRALIYISTKWNAHRSTSFCSIYKEFMELNHTFATKNALYVRESN